MPARYQAIKESLTGRNPGMSTKELKTSASRIFIGTAPNRHRAAMSLVAHKKKKLKKLNEYA